MRLAIISDMHGNDVAFEAALADVDLRGCDQIVCLGDALQGGPQPVQVVERLRDRQIPVVMGNADAWLLSGIETGDEGIPEERMRKMNAARLWSLEQLSQADREFVESFQPTITVDLQNGQRLLCFHGSPSSFDDALFPDSPDERFHELLPCDEAQFFTGGHTHVQFVRHIGQGFHFNPGSAGSAYRHDQEEGGTKYDAFAEYAILEVVGDKLGLEFRRTPFDVEELISVYKYSGRPHSEVAIAGYGR